MAMRPRQNPPMTRRERAIMWISIVVTAVLILGVAVYAALTAAEGEADTAFGGVILFGLLAGFFVYLLMTVPVSLIFIGLDWWRSRYGRDKPELVRHVALRADGTGATFYLRRE